MIPPAWRICWRRWAMPAAEAPDDADMVILNTCHIREKAAEKVYSELGRLATLKARRRKPAAACWWRWRAASPRPKAKRSSRAQPAVDLVVGPQSYHRLPEMIARMPRGSGHVLETDFPALEKFDSLPEAVADTGVSAFLTVQEGCDKFCTFCVVPYTRGAEHSRPPGSDSAPRRAQLAARGAREIVLLGQNVNAYRGTDANGATWSLARLIEALAEIKDVSRIRYTTSHPRDMGDDLIAAHGDNRKADAAICICRCSRARTLCWRR